MGQYKMFGFIKKVFFTAMTFFSFNPLNVNYLECVSMNDQECKARPKIIDVNNNEPVFYPYSIKVNKFQEVGKIVPKRVVLSDQTIIKIRHSNAVRKICQNMGFL